MLSEIPSKTDYYKKFAWEDDNTISSHQTLRYNEYLGSDFFYSLPINDILFSEKTNFQNIKIILTKHFGKALIMDNKFQSCESDEAIYHESLVHPAMISHPNPKTVFIGGGGEGATAREVLKYNVDKVVMVDIDEVACEMCKIHMPEWNNTIWDDKRFEIHYEDCLAYLRKSDMKYDVIIMDICDPIEAGPGWVLYTKEFYAEAREKYLNPGGVFCTQSTGCNLNILTSAFTTICKTARDVFPNVSSFKADIPSFGAPWGFNLCSDNPVVSLQTGDLSNASFILFKSRLTYIYLFIYVYTL
eukprot:GHVL01027747.1.p1 GENE.GHVL01027747.1~~GHVL01027747.1.p1  ORF type:complete len:317 (+),score=57.79 GHVL01027747.1:49-951(+)